MLSKVSIQEEFLQKLRESRAYVSVFLKNGIKLCGYIADYDEDSILLKSSVTSAQMVSKHAIATIVPATRA